jgi:hypothetical protein
LDARWGRKASSGRFREGKFTDLYQRYFTEAERWLLRAAEQDYALAWNQKSLECCLTAKELGFDRADPYPPDNRLRNSLR